MSGSLNVNRSIYTFFLNFWLIPLLVLSVSSSCFSFSNLVVKWRWHLRNRFPRLPGNPIGWTDRILNLIGRRWRHPTGGWFLLRLFCSPYLVPGVNIRRDTLVPTYCLNKEWIIFWQCTAYHIYAAKQRQLSVSIFFTVNSNKLISIWCDKSHSCS